MQAEEKSELCSFSGATVDLSLSHLATDAAAVAWLSMASSFRTDLCIYRNVIKGRKTIGAMQQENNVI
jgi:hypothetical protein